MERGLVWAITAGEPRSFSLPVAITETTVPNAGQALPQSPSVGFAVAIAALLVGVGAAVVHRHEFGSEHPDHPDDPDRTGRAQDPPRECRSDVPRTDADHVEALLDDRGGRMRQTAIVQVTGWSKSKVSLLLSEMEADGRIRKVRVGRENLILAPGAEPDVILGDADG